MPKWLDLNEVDDDEILLKKNRMSRSLVLDTPEVADAAEEDFLDTMEPAKKSMTIFFMIDVSGSMKGTKIGSLNSTMEELLPSLIGVGEASTDVKIAIMKFSTDVEWVTPEPVKIEEYQYWNRLEADGLTFMGDAFMELSKKLSRSTFLSSSFPVNARSTSIFTLEPIPSAIFNPCWNHLFCFNVSRPFFQSSFGEPSDNRKITGAKESDGELKNVLRAFTGNDELAVQAKNADQLRELIKLLAVTSSQIGSRSLALVDSNGRQPAAETVAQAKQQVLVEEIRTGAKDILGEAVDLGAVNYDEGW